MPTSRVGPTPRPGDYQTRAYFDGQVAAHGRATAGRPLNLLLKLLTEMGSPPDPRAYVERAVAAVPTTDLELNPALYAGAMGDRGSVTNLREDNVTVGHQFAAAFRRPAENYAACAGRLSPAQHPRLHRPRRARLCESSEDALLGLLTLASFCAAGRTRWVGLGHDL